ncbi:MAG: acyl carrier protein [Kiritimatiellia bacterium]
MTGRIEDRLKKMLVERLFLKVSPEDIEEDKSLTETYGVDSVSLLEMVVGLEEEFGVAVDDEEFEVTNFQTIKALAEFVRSKTS